MKAKALVAILLISLVPLPSTTAQIPTASVSITCLDDDLNVTSLYNTSSSDNSIIYSPEIDDVRCTISNPTAYTQKVAISTTTNYPVSLVANEEIYVGGNSEEEFSVYVSIDESFIENYHLANDYWFYTNASVTEIDGLPPANQATASNSVTQIESENQTTCSECFILHHVLAGSRIGMTAPTYSGDLYDGEAWRSFNSDDAFDTSLATPFSTAWTALQFIDLNCPFCRQAASEEMVEWVDRFDPSNSSQGSPDVNIVTVVSELIPSFSIYEFSVTDASGTLSTNGADDLVYVAMDAGEDLSWATVIVQLSANGGAYTECTNPGKATDTGCAVSDSTDDGKWGFSEEITISEGSDDLCSTACTVQVKVLDAASNKLIYESTETSVN